MEKLYAVKMGLQYNLSATVAIVMTTTLIAAGILNAELHK